MIPVCGIGTYDAYLDDRLLRLRGQCRGAAYATTADLLAMVAGRALLVVSATRDALQFSVGEAAKSVAAARERFRLLGQEAKIRHVAIESGHDYNQPMREAMYGWVEKWLRGRGDGSPIPEPSITRGGGGSLRCYPDGPSRPKTIVTIPEFARREGLAHLARRCRAARPSRAWIADAGRMKTMLRDQILGGFPKKTPLESEAPAQPERSGTSRSRPNAAFGRRRPAWSGAADTQGTAVVVVPRPKTGIQNRSPKSEIRNPESN